MSDKQYIPSAMYKANFALSE